MLARDFSYIVAKSSLSAKCGIEEKLPDGLTEIKPPMPAAGGSLSNLKVGGEDSLKTIIREILFKGRDYAIYRSDRGVFVHFSDSDAVERAQRAVYVKLSVQICELRYLTCQMRPGAFRRVLPLSASQDLLYDHNMAQALMLLMESVVQLSDKHDDEAAATQAQARDIAKRALDMAVRRVTVDNTIGYVSTCVAFGIVWLGVLSVLHFKGWDPGQLKPFLLASGTGIIGAVFSVITRAQAFQLQPCEDSGMNRLMSLIRVGMGGIAGPALFLLLYTVSANALPGLTDATRDNSAFIRMIAVIGLIGGFAERLVPNLVGSVAQKIQTRDGTPGQGTQSDRTDKPATGGAAAGSGTG